MIPLFTATLLVGFLLIPSVNAQQAAKARADSLGDPLPEGAIARLGTLRLKHDPGEFAILSTAVFSPDGKKVASVGGSQGYINMGIHLWDTLTGKEYPGPWSFRD